MRVRSIGPAARHPPGPILRTVTELDEPRIREESVVHVSSAKVLFAEYALLQNDFPELSAQSLTRKNPGLSQLGGTAMDEAIREIIDDWLLANAAFVSVAQTHPTPVNTDIVTDGEPIIAHRPPLYGRATVVSNAVNRRASGTSRWSWNTSPGLLDLKGAGVAPGCVPSTDEHSNGLEYAAVALGDFLIKRAIDEIFRRAAPTLWTVPIYAIIDLGFDIRNGFLGTSAAGLHVRRAHRRAPTGTTVPRYGSGEDAVKVDTEMVLRNYGFTTTTGGHSLRIEAYDGALTVRNGREALSGFTQYETAILRRLLADRERVRIDRINVQLSRVVDGSDEGGQMVDFGHVHAQSGFEYPVTNPVRDRPLCMGGILWPTDDAYIQPSTRLAAPYPRWRRSAINDLCLSLIERSRAGDISRTELRHSLEEPLAELIAQWGED